MAVIIKTQKEQEKEKDPLFSSLFLMVKATYNKKEKYTSKVYIFLKGFMCIFWGRSREIKKNRRDGITTNEEAKKQKQTKMKTGHCT